MSKSIAPHRVAQRFQQGLHLHQTGRLAEAKKRYAEVLDADPRHLGALQNSAVLAGQAGDYATAVELLQRALTLDGRVAAVHSNLAFAYQRLGRWPEALTHYDRAVALNGAPAPVLVHRGDVLLQLGRPTEALASFERAIQLESGSAEAHYGRANALRETGALEAACTAYQRALALRPSFPEAQINLGFVLESLGRPDEALTAYRAALTLTPQSAEVHYNCGNALKELGRIDEALASYRAAIALRPDYAQAHFNCGVLARERLEVGAALDHYAEALRLEPDLAAAHFDTASLYLVSGDLERGFTEYEWRWRYQQLNEQIADGSGAIRPLWQGAEPLADRTILLWAEQGLGDALQFCRYVPKVAALGARVILRAPAPLLRLFDTLTGVHALLPDTVPLPAFDCHCPLLSLPRAFGTTLATIPSEVPYLHADPARVAEWRDVLGPRRGLRVGLVWSGGFRPDQPEVWGVNGRRNIALARLAPLKHPAVEFYTLQKGQPAESELAETLRAGWDGPPLIDHTQRLGDFADTAAFLENLDLLISVDTSSAHLAGALGRPVWIMNRFDTCWRWLLDRADSPWYPTARLYRQAVAGDWDDVVQRVRADLVTLVEARPGPRVVNEP